MDTLWTPEAAPPQVDSKVTDKLMSRLLDQGLTKVFQDGVELFKDTQPLLRNQIKRVTVDGLEDARPIIAMRAGAVLANYAYVESGYDQTVDSDAIVVGAMEAELEGVPTIYLASWHNDQELQRLVDTLLDTPELQDGADTYDYSKLLHIGAGCVRHYMRFAIAA